MRPDRLPLARSLLLAALLAAPLAGAAVTAAAQEGARQTRQAGDEAPLVVESNEMVIRDPEQEAVYTGDVVATKGDMVLRAERLVVHYTDAGIKRAHAYGEPVTMEQGDRHGRAAEAIYTAADRSLLLVGDARLEEGPNTLEGARIRYFMDARRTEVFSESGEEKGRARAVFQPGSEPGDQDGDGQGDQGAP